MLTRSASHSARKIPTPSGAQVDGVVEIRGRATVADGARFGFYRILIGEGRTPVSLRPLGPPYDRPVDSGMLATWDTDRFPSGEDFISALSASGPEPSARSATTRITTDQEPTGRIGATAASAGTRTLHMSASGRVSRRRAVVAFSAILASGAGLGLGAFAFVERWRLLRLPAEAGAVSQGIATVSPSVLNAAPAAPATSMSPRTG